MSLATNLSNFATRVSTELKALRTLLNGNQADLSGLTTTAKGNIVAAINEVDAAVDDIVTNGIPSSLGDLTDVVYNLGNAPVNADMLVYNNSINAWTNINRDSVADLITPYISLNDLSDVTAEGSQNTVLFYDYGAMSPSWIAAPIGSILPDATEVIKGVVRFATNTETSEFASVDAAVTPLGLDSFYSDVVYPTFALRSSLADVATSGDFADLTGTIPTSALPALAITSVQVVTNQAARLALTNVQEGDIVKQTDNSSTWILAATPASTAANWVQLESSGAVLSVNGQTGAVVITKSTVGLANVDNTSDANKPISTATQTALNNKQPIDNTLTALAGVTTAANTIIYATGSDTFSTTSLSSFGRTLIDDADSASARTTLSVYSQAQIGNPEQDLVAIFEAGLV